MVNLDKEAQRLIEEKPNLMIPWLLMASYLYYHKNESMFSDEYYDALSKELLLKWDEVEHSYKHLVTKDDLMAGSLYKLKEEDYPLLYRAAAIHLLKEKK